MNRFNLLPWFFVALLWGWGSLMYEQRMQLQEEAQQVRREASVLRNKLTAQENQYMLDQVEATRLRYLGETRLAELSELQQQLLDLRTELGMYRQVMAPEFSAGGLVVDQLQLEPMLSPGHYRLRVILMQRARRRVQLGGHIELVVSGSQAQQPVRLSWPEVNLSGKEKVLPFSFLYFQVLEGELLLPPQFQPEGIELGLFVDSPRSARVERQLHYDWQQLIAEEGD